MPELPDIELYLSAIESRVRETTLRKIRIASPFLLRTVDPPLSAVEGRPVRALRRLGKRIVFAFDEELFVVVHLMIAGRFQWKAEGAKIPAKLGLAAFDFERGTLLLTEASKKKRASLHVLRGESALAAMDPGGIEPLDATADEFRAAITARNHTVKRALTDPRILSGIGNAYSDEILFRARLSPIKWTERLTDEENHRLHEATQEVLRAWTQRLRDDVGEGFPEKVTAFRPEMAVHGKYREPCPICGEPVQRIAYADNETNYCAVCQNEGKLLADRSLSRLLKGEWPKTLEELEEKKRDHRDALHPLGKRDDA